MTIAVMKQALECLESLAAEPPGVRALHPNAVVIQNLRAAIAEAERQEPVGEVRDMKYGAVRFYGKPTERKYLPDGTKLYTTPQPAIPAGMALVPVEPTGEMSSFKNTGVHWQISERIYKAMLAAAPKPENSHE